MFSKKDKFGFSRARVNLSDYQIYNMCVGIKNNVELNLISLQEQSDLRAPFVKISV